jgi:uncharacterized protein (DUF1778 family)
MRAPVMEANEKSARLELRSTPEQKSMIERAASLMGESVTSFVLSTVLRDARRVIHEHSVTELSLDDWARFTAILESDEMPTPALTEAAKAYRKRVRTSDGF